MPNWDLSGHQVIAIAIVSTLIWFSFLTYSSCSKNIDSNSTIETLIEGGADPLEARCAIHGATTLCDKVLKEREKERFVLRPRGLPKD